MKTKLASASRLLALAATLAVLPAFAVGKNATSVDQAKQWLDVRGLVPVSSAGPYVEIGTFQIQVATKLGQPAARLADGTWLYRGFAVTDSAATGALLVRFEQGRVSSLTLVTPAVATALLTPQKAGGGSVVADSK